MSILYRFIVQEIIKKQLKFDQKNFHLIRYSIDLFENPVFIRSRTEYCDRVLGKGKVK